MHWEDGDRVAMVSLTQTSDLSLSKLQFPWKEGAKVMTKPGHSRVLSSSDQIPKALCLPCQGEEPQTLQ